MKIYYFAWVRDHIGYPYEDISCPKTVKTIEQLAQYLKDQSDGHRRAFQDLSSIRAAKTKNLLLTTQKWQIPMKLLSSHL